ncbi:MAG TPA: rRNA maturation RNase YbeY [Sulfurimonas sp.]|nr:rRNA maturation RNase YbeY [Sulfurimonas sp.]HIM74642.1 rRNA maturation RNase YbeY [Campylobacterales bacterium]
MIELDNRTNLIIDISLLQLISDTLTNKEIELIITSNSEIQSINAECRNINKPTDVLSFPYEEMPMSPLGSIVISEDFVKEKASELGHTDSDELTLLFIHGLLHLLGYDHEIDSGEMREKEKDIIELYTLPNSLIVRNQG